jgi:uncharacterized membrane protein YoaK (UPF0700 family)
MQRITTHSSDSAGRPQGIAPHPAREPSWAALLLAWTAAFSDAIGILVLQQLGASFMSGNSLAMGVALWRLEWVVVLQRGLPILVFFLGNLLSFLVLTQVRRRGMRSPFAIVFGLEAVSLLAFLLLGTHALQGGVIPPFSGTFSVCVMLLTLALGLQTATVRRAGGQSVRTTFVTGVRSRVGAGPDAVSVLAAKAACRKAEASDRARFDAASLVPASSPAGWRLGIVSCRSHLRKRSRAAPGALCAGLPPVRTRDADCA